MDNIVLEITDPSKRQLLLSLLAELDFVRVQEQSADYILDLSQPNSNSIFDAVGIWRDREVDAEKLRKAAWRT